MKRIFPAAVLCISSLSLNAHEFWLDSDRFFYDEGETAVVRFHVGEDFTGTNWSGNDERVQYLRDMTDGSLWGSDLRGAMHEKGDSLRVKLRSAGTHIVAFNSTSSFISLPAGRFNEYLKDEGLNDAILQRHAAGRDGDSGREYYQRSVKILLQAGNRKWDISRASGIPLDIIPLRNPYDITKPREIIFRVLYRGGPYAKALIKVWHRTDAGKVQPAIVRTNEKGELAVMITPDGKWMLSCVYMERKKEGLPEWQSYWGSLVFGYQR